MDAVARTPLLRLGRSALRFRAFAALALLSLPACDTTAPLGPPSAAKSSVSADPTSIVASSDPAQGSTITVTARDESGAAIVGARVVLAVTGTGNALVQPAGPTDPTGRATGFLNSTDAGTKTVSATIDGLSVTQLASVTVRPASPSLSRSTVTATPSPVVAGAPTTVEVTVRDEFGNGVPGIAVVLAATGTGNTLVQPASPTDVNGRATGILSSTDAGTKTVSALIDGIPVEGLASFTVRPAAASRTRSSVKASPGTIPAGAGTAVVSVTARDAFGNAIAGANVTLVAASGSGVTLTQPTATDAGGIATGTFRSTAAGIETITAVIDGMAVAETAPVTVLPGPVSAIRSSLVVSPSAISAGTGESVITVTAYDAFGNGVPGLPVSIGWSGSLSGFLTIDQPGRTDTNGVAIGRLRAAGGGAWTLYAAAGQTSLAQTATVISLLVRHATAGLSAPPFVQLPLILPSGVSMQVGVGAQLEVTPGVAVTWSSSNPGLVSLNTTGGFSVFRGNENPSLANEARITATGSGASASIRVNSFAFDHFPRLTTLIWRPVTGAVSYDLVVDYANGCTPGTAVCSTWSTMHTAGTSGFRYVLEFVGAQPGRWRVVARNGSGGVISTSEFVYFGYVR